jgi:hypothetical protein
VTLKWVISDLEAKTTMSASKPKTHEPKTHAVLSGTEVRNIVGDVDDATVVEILGTGANGEQVLEAFMRVSGNTAPGEELEKPADTIVLQVMEALSRDEEFEDEK